MDKNRRAHFSYNRSVNLLHIPGDLAFTLLGLLADVQQSYLANMTELDFKIGLKFL